jgi:predicted membrane channel-forming protein YqfA (hemolysin III family)
MAIGLVASQFPCPCSSPLFLDYLTSTQIWHCMVIVGAVCHYFCIFLYVLPFSGAPYYPPTEE